MSELQDRQNVANEIIEYLAYFRRGRKWLLKRIATYHWPGRPRSFEKWDTSKILQYTPLEFLQGALKYARSEFGPEYRLSESERSQLIEEILNYVEENLVSKRNLTNMVRDLSHDDLEEEPVKDASEDAIVNVLPSDVLTELMKVFTAEKDGKNFFVRIPHESLTNDWIQKAAHRYKISGKSINSLNIKVDGSTVVFCTYVDDGQKISWMGHSWKKIDFEIILSHLTTDFYAIPLKLPSYKEFVKKASEDPRTWIMGGPDCFTLSKSLKVIWRSTNPNVTFDISKWINSWDMFGWQMSQ